MENTMLLKSIIAFVLLNIVSLSVAQSPHSNAPEVSLSELVHAATSNRTERADRMDRADATASPNRTDRTAGTDRTIRTLDGSALVELRAVKITNVDSQVMFSDAAIAEAMDYLHEIGINAILPVVQNAGYTQYRSAVMDYYFNIPLDPRLGGRDPLAVIVREARRVGIEVYPWFEYGFASHYSGPNPATGGFIGQRYPHWMSRDAAGNICKKNGFEWMSGINPEVQEFIIALVMEVVRNYDVDGVEFSDRMPALPRECGYDEVTVNIYRAENGGADPSPFFQNAAWMRWRAAKLNDFYRAVRDSVKSYDANLFVASSPSIYPWAFTEYLQDPETWVRDGIIDHVIPQLYRTNMNDYTYELTNTLSRLPAERRHIYYAGILMNVGSYLISPELLGQQIEANRAAGVAGEAYFFYEGLRKDQNELGNFLRDNYYQQPALVPDRPDGPRRMGALFADASWRQDPFWTTLPGTTPYGNWQAGPATPAPQGVHRTTDFSVSMASDRFDIPHPTGWYDIYMYTSADPQFARQAYMNEGLNSEVHPSTRLVTINAGTDGWHFVGTYRVAPAPTKSADPTNANAHHTAEGNAAATDMQWLFSLDHNVTLELTGKPVAIANVMAVMNQRLGPVETSLTRPDELPAETLLVRNWPNPFNPSTTISVQLPEATTVQIAIYDLTGRRVGHLHEGWLSAGSHEFNWSGARLSSGIYLLQVLSPTGLVSHRLTLLK
jgi:uncharacterized lipoprotein YddW (UPF0748 family)